MKKNSWQYFSGLIAATVLVGCSQSEPPTVMTLSVNDDPCAIVLVSEKLESSAIDSGIDKSILRYQKAASSTSKSLPHLERLGWAYVEKAREDRDPGYYKLAEQTASCIENQEPGSSEAMLLRGHVLHNLHNFSEAEKLARRLVNQRGLWFDYALLGDVLIERGELKEAVDVYQQVVDQRPGPQAYMRVAQLRWLKGDQDGALEMMTRAARSTSPRSPEPAAWVHVRLALMLMQADELNVADSVLDRALSLKPGYPPALHARGRLLLAQDKPQHAVSFLQQAVGVDPLPQFRWTLYEALRQTGQLEAANEQEAALHKSGAMDDRRTFSLFLATTGKNSETALRLAFQELEQREDVFTLDAVAWALSVAGSNAQALEYSRRALSEGTQDARLHLHAGVIAARAGEHKRALELLNRASTSRQMLLPTEQQLLVKEFAELQPRISTLISVQPDRRVTYNF